MKKIITSLVFISLAAFSFSQDEERLNEIMDIVSEQDSIDRAVFLDFKFNDDLVINHQGNWRQIWASKSMSKNEINQFYDIRLKFDSNKEALAFHKEYKVENSENGPVIKKHKIKIKGVDELGVYTQQKLIAKSMLEPMGFQAFCFIFVVDNYFVKMYTVCPLSYKAKDFEKYIVEAKNKIGKQ